MNWMIGCIGSHCFHFLQKMMPEQRSRGAAFEYDATVEEIKDNMKSILGKVNFASIQVQPITI